MKSIISVLLIIATASGLLSQVTKEYTIHDFDNNPLSDVLVYHGSEVIAITNDMGKCEINSNINKILFHRLGCIDTIVYLKTITDKIIRLNCQNFTDTVNIEGKYNAKRHLKNLWKMSQSIYNITDTTIYYRFKIHFEIPGSNQSELMTGTIKVPYSGDHGFLYYQDAYYCYIDHYKNTISNENYDYLPTNLIRLVLNGNILMGRDDWRALRKGEINNKFQKHDSIVFSSMKNNDYYSIVGFKDSVLIYTEHNYDKSQTKIRDNNKTKLYNIYYKMCFSNDSLKNNIFPTYATTVRRYLLGNGAKMACFVELISIDTCSCKLDKIDSKVYISRNNKNSFNYIREQQDTLNIH